MKRCYVQQTPFESRESVKASRTHPTSVTRWRGLPLPAHHLLLHFPVAGICLPSPHGSPTWFHFWASHPPTLALSSVTQPKAHADSFPSPMVTLLAARLGTGPLPHSLSAHLVLPGHLPRTWGYLLKLPHPTPFSLLSAGSRDVHLGGCEVVSSEVCGCFYVIYVECF